jgi:hypothetical protein
MILFAVSLSLELALRASGWWACRSFHGIYKLYYVLVSREDYLCSWSEMHSDPGESDALNGRCAVWFCLEPDGQGVVMRGGLSQLVTSWQEALVSLSLSWYFSLWSRNMGRFWWSWPWNIAWHGLESCRRRLSRFKSFMVRGQLVPVPD